MMRKALRAKFEQHAELRTLLLATASAKLVEHTQNDAYWGDGGNGQGKNRLVPFNGVARTIGCGEVTHRVACGR